MEAFFNQLAAGIFPLNRETGEPAVTREFEQFRSHCEAREMRGRDTFGLAYLVRDNPAEAEEEAVDLALYMHLDILQHLRNTGTDDDFSLGLEAARHAYLAHKAVRELAAKRRGSP